MIWQISYCDVIEHGTGRAALKIGGSNLEVKQVRLTMQKMHGFAGFNGKLVTVTWVGF